MLHVAAPAYIICIAATALTSQIADRQLQAAYLIGLHVAFGAAAAGTGLATGNIALKTAEGTARQIAGYLREAMSRTLMARIGYLFARGAFQRLGEKMEYIQAVLLSK